MVDGKENYKFGLGVEGLNKWEVDSNIISNEEVCGDNSSNNKIWWRPLRSDGTSEDKVAVILAIKQNINNRVLIRS